MVQKIAGACQHVTDADAAFEAYDDIDDPDEPRIVFADLSPEKHWR